ncbi:glycoside hydrolase family 13 protein [Clavulina sp. PMI_390]|nr:glycoside hydrolase family 13 protein [Clavulina sp. PMI_390]
MLLTGSLGLLLLPQVARFDGALAATADQWRNRTIYQLLTDRFATTSGSTTASCTSGYEGYCGGTWQGIINKLPYIKGMGFDAIWISPVTQQVSDPTRGWTGYAQNNLYNVNTNFGSAQDLKNLAAALHSNNMYLMVDVVANHFGYDGDSATIDYSTMTPFNTASDFHTPICWIVDYTNQTEVEQCWLGDESYPLPDVKTTLSSVRSTYASWIQSLISTYSIDGLRVDTVKHVEKDFWSAFQSAAGVYAVGEVADGDIDYVCPYQNYLNGLLNYPMYYQLTEFFETSSATSDNLVSAFNYVNTQCVHPTFLGPFSENHDQPRFPSLNSDMSAAKNVIAWTMLADGMPIIYSGQEQHYNGGNDPYNREAIWLSGYNTSSELYIYITLMNKIRKLAIAKAPISFTVWQSMIIYSDDHHVAVRKGDTGAQIVAVYNNFGSTVTSTYTRSLTSTYYGAGTVVMELLGCTTVTVDSSGNLLATFNPSGQTPGLPLIYFPKSLLSGSGICSQ